MEAMKHTNASTRIDGERNREHGTQGGQKTASGKFEKSKSTAGLLHFLKFLARNLRKSCAIHCSVIYCF